MKSNLLGILRAIATLEAVRWIAPSATTSYPAPRKKSQRQVRKRRRNAHRGTPWLLALAIGLAQPAVAQAPPLDSLKMAEMILGHLEVAQDDDLWTQHPIAKFWVHPVIFGDEVLRFVPLAITGESSLEGRGLGDSLAVIIINVVDCSDSTFMLVYQVLVASETGLRESSAIVWRPGTQPWQRVKKNTVGMDVLRKACGLPSAWPPRSRWKG